eukprot:scaffold7781_cov105-Skeletonema_marinoi.AAC.1
MMTSSSTSIVDLLSDTGSDSDVQIVAPSWDYGTLPKRQPPTRSPMHFSLDANTEAQHLMTNAISWHPSWAIPGKIIFW